MTDPSGAGGDVITLGGQVFPVKGIAQGNGIQEFETGLKTGNATYDNRTQAFYSVLEDFSGGMGHRFYNQRDPNENTFWDYPIGIPAADTRRRRHLTLGPKQTVITPNVQPAGAAPDGISVLRSPSYPYWGFSGTWQYAMTGAIYQTVDGVNFTQKLDLAVSSPCTSIALYSSYKSQFTLYAAFPSGNYYRSDDAGATWQVGGPTTHILNDLIFWDEKIIAAENNTLIFGIRSPTSTPLSDTSNQTISTESVIEDEIIAFYQPVLGSSDQSAYVTQRTTRSTVVGTTGTTVTLEIETFRYEFVTNGPSTGPGSETSTQTPIQVGSTKEVTSTFTKIAPTTPADSGAVTDIWNIDDDNDANPVGVVPRQFINFVGIAQAPWGEPAVYFTAPGVGGMSLWVLDFYARKVYPIHLGLELQITDARIWNGRIMVMDGWNVYEYDPGKGQVMNVGLPRVDGVPPSLQGPDLRLWNLITSDAYLYGIVRNSNLTAGQSATAYRGRMMCHNGKGWHQIGDTVTSFVPTYGALAAYEQANPPTRKLHMFGVTTGSVMEVVNYDIPTHSNVPDVGGDDHFQSSGGVITGWMDGGFADIDGVMLKMNIDALHLSSTETVTVYYQLDNAENSSWLPLYDSDGVAASFTDENTSLYFQPTNPLQGATFRTVRFKIILARGTDDTLTPEVRAFIFTYLKKPPFRSSWTLTIDVDRMLEAANSFTVDSAAATFANVWAKLISLWNTQPLLTLDIPSIELTGLNVMVADSPLSFDDFSTAVNGHGTITLKVLEPISRA